VDNQIVFEIRRWDETGRELVPLVDGVSLVDLVSEFEHAAGDQPAGGYAGLVLDHGNFGDLGNYLHGKPDSPYRRDAVALLGCNCGDVGCWPLQAQIHADASSVTWTTFTQPHRPDRNYTPFGPFTFRRPQYDKAIQACL
jgi:hypothetical protein